MQLNKLFSAINDDRSEHEAILNSSGQYWNDYVKMHHEMHGKADAKVYKLVNSKNEILDEANDPHKLDLVNGTVKHEDFLKIQEELTEVRRRDLHGINDLKANGLSFGVSLEETLVGFENVNEFRAAKQEMNPNSFDNNDSVFTQSYVPNPITHSSFSVPWRQQGFDYKRSAGMSESMRQVSERLETTLFNGNTSVVLSFNGTNFPIYGYTTHPNRGTDTISDWSDPANNQLIVPELTTQLGLMWSTQGGVKNKSVMAYVGNGIYTQMEQDYKQETGGTIIERAMKNTRLKGITPIESLVDNEVVLVEMDKRTIQLAQASDIVMVPHTKLNAMSPQVMTTYAAMVQQIKVDSIGATGIRHLTV